MLKSLRALALAFGLIATPVAVHADQADYEMPLTGPMSFPTFLSTWLNPALQAIITNNSGASAPTTTGQPETYQWWVDTSSSPSVLKLYDGTSWLSVATIDTSGHVLGLTGTSLTLSTTSAGTAIIATSTESGAGTGPDIDLYRNSSSVAASDSIGSIFQSGKDASGSKQIYGRISNVIGTTTAGAEDSVMTLATVMGGTVTNLLLIGNDAAFSGGAGTFESVGLPRGRLSFPATQNASSNANTIDDFEEGQTTPTITSGTGTITTVSSSLDYVKVGKLVSVTFSITMTTNNTGASYLKMPLPFTAESLRYGGGGFNTTAGYGINIGPFDTTMAAIYKYDGTYPIANGNTLYGSFVYRAAN